jgi:hypothetical protein
MSAKRLRLLTMIGVVLITAVIAAGVILSYATRDGRVVPLPEAGGEAPQDSVTPDDNLDRVTITVDNVQRVIESLHRPDSYSRRFIVETFYAKGDGSGRTSAGYDISVSVYGGAQAIRVRDGRDVKNIIIAGGRMYIWYNNDAAYKEVPVQPAVYGGEAAQSAADEFQMLLTYEDVLAVEKEKITEAGYISFNDENCIYVRFEYGRMGYTTVCYISTASGLLTGAEQFDGQQLVYRMIASEYSAAVPDLSAFNLPDGKNAVSGI